MVCYRVTVMKIEQRSKRERQPIDNREKETIKIAYIVYCWMYICRIIAFNLNCSNIENHIKIIGLNYKYFSVY